MREPFAEHLLSASWVPGPRKHRGHADAGTYVGPTLEGSLTELFQKQQVRPKQRKMKENWPDGRGEGAFLTEGPAAREGRDFRNIESEHRGEAGGGG